MAPETLTLKRHRDLAGQGWKPWARRAVALLLITPLVLGLLNVFGQRPDTSEAETARAKLKVYAPKRLRGGLFFEARFTIDARQELKNATLVLEPDWMEGMTLNSVEPAPIGEASRDGKLVFELGHVRKGDSYVFYLQFQVNPTNIGRRSQDVTLFDGSERILHIDRTVNVWP